MTMLHRIFGQEDLNFLLTNRIPRRLVTQLVGWVSQIEQPVVRDLSLAAWQLFADLELNDAATTHWKSVHDCFTRQLRAGARPIDRDPAIVVSPCDGIIGGCGQVRGTELIQAKGFPYTLEDLLGDADSVDAHRDGQYVTLRLSSSMYHRFHAPHDLHVDQVTYIHGDTWNTNPIALQRVEKLFCKNERAVLRGFLADGQRITLVAVASILVASLRLHFLDLLLHLDYRGPRQISCDASARKGEELGYFQHGSTIIVFAPTGFALCDNVRPGQLIRVGQPLLRRP